MWACLFLFIHSFRSGCKHKVLHLLSSQRRYPKPCLRLCPTGWPRAMWCFTKCEFRWWGHFCASSIGECQSKTFSYWNHGKSLKVFVNVTLYCSHVINVWKNKIQTSGLRYETYFIITIYIFSISTKYIWFSDSFIILRLSNELKHNTSTCTIFPRWNWDKLRNVFTIKRAAHTVH